MAAKCPGSHFTHEQRAVLTIGGEPLPSQVNVRAVTSPRRRTAGSVAGIPGRRPEAPPVPHAVEPAGQRISLTMLASTKLNTHWSDEPYSAPRP